MRCPECALRLEFVTDGTYRCKICKWFGVIISTDDIFNYLLTHKKEELMKFMRTSTGK